MTKTSSPKLTRRFVIAGTFAGIGGVALAKWYNIGAREEDGMNVNEAYAAAIEGRITLIDIRRLDEWAATGIGQGAVPIDMRDPEFTTKLRALVPDQNARIALICARGVRSRHLAGRPVEAGFTHIIDVPEGMLGSGAGPGWLSAGLPVTKR